MAKFLLPVWFCRRYRILHHSVCLVEINIQHSCYCKRLADPIKHLIYNLAD